MNASNTGIHMSQLQQQQQTVQNNLQPGGVMSSPGKANFSHSNLAHIQQQQQPQTGVINRQIIMQQQSAPSPSPNAIFASNQGQRLMAQNSNISSPHPTPTSTPNPPIIYSNEPSESNNNNQQQVQNPSLNSWQQQQQQGPTTNNQSYNPLMANRGINLTGGNIGSPAPPQSTASPSPLVQQQSQYQQQQYINRAPQTLQQQQPQQPPPQQQQQQQPNQNNLEYVQSLIARYKQATTPAEKNQTLQEIGKVAPNIYQRIVQFQQQSLL